MNARSLLRRAVQGPLGRLGYTLSRTGVNATCSERLAGAIGLGFRPQVVYDCGAYLGHWTRDIAPLLPGSQFVLCEPNPAVLGDLRQAIRDVSPAAVIVEAAVGAEPGTATLNVWDNAETSAAGSSLLGHVQGQAGTQVDVPVRPIDDIALAHGLPDLLKLDLQGAEKPALLGATNALAHAEMAIVEFGCLEAYEGRTTPRDLMELMYQAGFVLYDVVDLGYRPYDGALTGGDFFFVKTTSALRAHKGYR